MKKILLLTILFTLVIGWLPIARADEKEEAATKAAQAWLALVDNGKYEESWKEAAKLFQSAVTKEKWVAALNQVRSPLGKLSERKLKLAQYTKTLPGAPAGDYVVIQFDASFENKKGAVETVTPTLDSDGKWRVSGYYIK